MGYSLGGCELGVDRLPVDVRAKTVGVIGRYLIGLLHARSFFKRHRPASFSTAATPVRSTTRRGPT